MFKKGCQREIWRLALNMANNRQRLLPYGKHLEKVLTSSVIGLLGSATGIEKEIIFENTALSDLGITVKNKIDATFANFGLAITYDDKVQILLSLLNDLMEGK